MAMRYVPTIYRNEYIVFNIYVGLGQQNVYLNNQHSFIEQLTKAMTQFIQNN